MIEPVFIPLNNQSRREDLELRYALRSIEKHLPETEIIIVGHKPNWITNITHIPFTETSHKQANIRAKILRALEIYQAVLFTNDDIFLLQDCESVPYYYSGELSQVSEKGAKPLLTQLKAQNLPLKHFDIHFPISYDQRFKEAINHFTDDCIIKSSYCNYLRIEGVETTDLKINSHLQPKTIKESIKGRVCFSVGDWGFDLNMIDVLNELFPNKSKYEL